MERSGMRNPNTNEQSVIPNGTQWNEETHTPLIALIPGSAFPSIYSNIAPPPVET